MSLPSPRPLIVRLRNWVGDVTLSLPLLQRLADAGYSLRLVGKPWAQDLLAGHGWPVHGLPKTWVERVRLLRQLKCEMPPPSGSTSDINALCLPDSFSSALEFRLAGLRAVGHAWEGRSPLLARALPRERGVHELKVYWQLGHALLGRVAPLPKSLGLKLAPQHLAKAALLRAQHGIESGCIMLCPFAGGTWNQQDKTWPEFPTLAAQGLPRFGRSLVICPGPGEVEFARQHFGHCHVLADVDLGTYAALLHEAALMVSNDTGPGHIAAAVGTPLVTVMGPSDPALWRPWGPAVQVVQGADGWPGVDGVMRAIGGALARSARHG